MSFARSGSSVVKVLVGTKCDLTAERVVTKEQGKLLAERHSLLFFETSAKDDIGVNDVFVAGAKEALRLQEEEKEKFTSLHKSGLQGVEMMAITKVQESSAEDILVGKMKLTEKIMMMISIILYYYDLVGDVLVLERFHRNGDYIYFGLSLAIMIVSMMIGAFFAFKAGGSERKVVSSRRIHQNKYQGGWIRGVAQVFQLGILWETWDSLKAGQTTWALFWTDVSTTTQ